MMRPQFVDGGEWLVERITKIFVVAMFVLSALVSAGALRAQTGTATLGGRVTDPQGGAVAGAEVVMTNMDTNVELRTKTNAEGLYVFAGTQPGRYRVSAGLTGFKTLIKENLVLHVQDEVAENFALELGSVSETLTVNGSGLNINTTDGSVSTVVERNFVENIPLNGRSFQDLIALTPGVVTHTPQSGGYVGTSGDFSVNGQRTESNEYSVDGVSANTSAGSAGVGPGTSGSLSATTALGTTQSLLSVDALQEFRVESSTYSAEYGLSPGGQFSFITRSGTNAFHGSVLEYFRNDVFDANNWFNDHYGIPKPALRQNDFGGTVGGPVSMPGIYDGKDRTFFFVSYEGLRLTQPTEATPGEFVPSVSLRAAAPSAVQPILNAFPLPTGPEIQTPCDNVTFTCPTGQPLGTEVPSGLAPFLKAYSLPSKINSTLLRLDHQFSARTHLFLRAAYTPSSTDTRTLSRVTSEASNQETYAVGLDTQLLNGYANELRVGYSRSLAKLQNTLDNFGGATPIDLSRALGNNGSPTSYNDFNISFNGVGGTDLNTQASANYQSQWSVSDTLAKSMGRHSLKVGFSYRRINSSFAAEDPDVSVQYLSPTSILNNAADGAEFERERSPEPVYNEFAFFGQDEWRITPVLNISLGLRWELDPAPYSTSAVKPYPLLGDVNNPSTYSLGSPGGQIFNTTWHNLAPRLGVAWQARRNPGAELVVRGGFGIFYDTGAGGTYNLFQGLGTQVYTNVSNVALPVSSAEYNDLSFNVSPPYHQTIYAVNPHLQLPYTLQWNIATEQELGKTQNVTLSYVGANGRRLLWDNYISGGSLNPIFPTVSLFVNGLTSNYQALQIQYQSSKSHGLQALASYTWSHSFDYGSTNSYGYTRGNSDFDVRDNFNAAVTWDAPRSTGNALSRALLNGWGTDARFFARTGFPVTLNGSYFLNPVTGTGQYLGLDLVPDVPVYLYSSLFPGGRSANAKAFKSAPMGSVGDAPRNFLRGFGMTQMDLAVRREFPLFESLKLQFRAEAFNVLNHPNFGYVDPRLGDATFGQATSTLANSLGTVSSLYQQGGARSVQFALKLVF